jgi:hypothetical protein
VQTNVNNNKIEIKIFINIKKNIHMGSFVDELSKCVTEGYVSMPKSIYLKPDVYAIVQEFFRIQESSPPQEIHQLEAFGGTICRIVINQLYVDFEILNVQNWMFIIHICKEHKDIEYLVVCVLVVLNKILFRKDIIDISSIHNEIYSFLVLLTEYHSTKKVYWSRDLILTWLRLFDVNTELHSIFLQNNELVLKFLDILTCKGRGDIIPCTNTWTSKHIFVRNGLVRLHGTTPHELCFRVVYDLHLKKNMLFQRTIAQYWPFVLGEDGQLLPENIISNIIKQIKVEESTPKSARKR